VVRHGWLLWALVCVASPVAAQISPGPLAKPHEQLEGALQCDKCHGGGRGRKEQVSARCLACHKEIGWLVQQQRGFHAGVREQRCAECHPDHAGKDFALISWPGGSTERFDHTTAGWPLDGGHRKVKCADCHKARFRISQAATLSQRRPPDVGWVGLERRCVACHDDVHHGRLGTACDKCHVAAAWKTINKSSFDHDKTKYPLRGKHALVACEKCHDFSAGKMASNPRFANCTDCHKDDHAGTATLAGRIVDCTSCHTVSGWQPSSYTVTQHRLAKYPLEGKHAEVKCNACHVKNPPRVSPGLLGVAGVWMRPVATQCRDCHGDDHGQQLARRSDRGACNACHSMKGWKPSTYTPAMHANLRLRLEGRHAEIECRACHGPNRVGLPALPDTQVLGHAGVAISLKEIECAACHVDPHKGRFAAGGARSKTQGCLACHGVRTFRPSTTDVAAHATFSFALEGAHRATACVACHGEFKRTTPAGRTSLLLAAAGMGELRFDAKHDCAACHETPHGRQFDARKDGGRCDACHGVDAFAPATKFDHARDAAFSTKGAHEKVPCNQCHPVDKKARTPNAVIYRPVSGKCESCHGKEQRRG
jgi:hypothetical protein